MFLYNSGDTLVGFATVRGSGSNGVYKFGKEVYLGNDGVQEERSPDVSNGLDIMDKSSYRNIPPL